MSLYSFGKVVCADESAMVAALRRLGARAGVSLVFRVDDGDLDEMTKVQRLQGQGVVFSIHSGPDEMDATRLWCDAMTSVRQCASSRTTAGAVGPHAGEAALACFLATRLGQACEGLFGLGCPAAVALVDGGIERVLSGSALECLHTIAADVRLPWDRSPNRLYFAGG
ncbi:MAG: hypothetical protein JNL21_28205 [Myxococcales bacterium]|nr:hypothetical protein [Myxococcales bacterium]